MTIFGDWLRQRARNISRAASGDNRAAAQLANQAAADPLGVDLEATRQALLVSIQAEENRRVRETHALAQERKEQSIIAALVFGCSCGSAWQGSDEEAFSLQIRAAGGSSGVGIWLRLHAHCAGLGAMVREDA